MRRLLTAGALSEQLLARFAARVIPFGRAWGFGRSLVGRAFPVLRGGW
ncbi:hypothetical protein [Streptomyces sp. NPDC088727]